MKRKRHAIEVYAPAGRPKRIRRRGRAADVQLIHDEWIYRSRWWSVDEQRRYFRLECDGMCIEIYELRGMWYCDAVWD